MNKKSQIKILILLVLALLFGSVVLAVLVVNKTIPSTTNGASTTLNRCREDCAAYKPMEAIQYGVGRKVDLDCVSKCLKIYSCEAK